MKISKQNRRDAKALFNVCRVNGVLDDARVRDTVTRVIQQKPRGFVGMLQRFQRLVQLDIARRSAHVESTTPLSPAAQQNVASVLAARYGHGLNLSFSTQPALIGGLRIKIGSDVYDASVAARLASLTDDA